MKLVDDLLPEVLAYGKKITGNPDLRTTFALNALVAVDNAAWLLYAHENGLTKFDDMIPAAYRPGLSYHHDKVASIPSFSVGTTAERIKQAADEGYFILKLKTGAAGTQAEMIEKDIAFLTAVHKAIGHYETPYTASGKIPYYFDANGRYEKKETLLRFLDHAKKIGAFDQIAVIEEPFAERKRNLRGRPGRAGGRRRKRAYGGGCRHAHRAGVRGHRREGHRQDHEHDDEDHAAGLREERSPASAPT